LAALSVAQDVPSAATVNAKARQALTATTGTAPASEPVARVVVYPDGRQLPAGFTDGPLRDAQVTCATMKDRNCIARYVVLRPGDPEVLLVFSQSSAYVFEADAAGRWRKSVVANGALLSCEPLRRAVETGTFSFEPHPWPDLMVGGQRFGLAPSTSSVCPRTTP
jgi:hypothetical protein